MMAGLIDDLHSEFNDLLGQESVRLDRYTRYRQEANKARDPDAEFFIQDNSDYGRLARTRHEQRFRHQINLPLGKALTVKHAFRIAGRLPDVVVDRRDESVLERHRSDTMERIVWAIIRASGGETLFSDGAWDASEIGATVFMPYFSIEKQMPLIKVCDPGSFFPVRGIYDPHDFKRAYYAYEAPLHSLRIDYPDVQFGQITPVTTSRDNIDYVRLVRYTDKEKSVLFACDLDQAVVLESYVHNYGFVPYAAIPNIGPYSEVFGWADYEFVRALVQYLPIMLSREADVLRAVANGAYVEKGTGQNAAQIIAVLNEGGVLPTKRDGSVEPIQAPEMPNFAEAHAARAFDLFKMLGFAPDAAWGAGGSTSGSDRGLMMQPLMEYTAMKQLNWQKGLQKLFSMCFQMIEKKQTVAARYTGTKPGVAGQRRTFSMILDPKGAGQEVLNDDPLSEEDFVELPVKPKEIFAGEYDARFVWNNRLDPDDPAFVTTELNKFTSGVQSLETTLERLGFQAPQDEMRRIEKEAEKFPWVNQGLVSLLIAQSKGNSQGEGGGNTFDQLGAGMDAADQFGQPGGDALATDLNTGQLGPDATGTPYGAA